MRMRETVLGDGLYEQRYTVYLGGVPLSFVRRPVAIEPPDGTLCHVDAGPRVGVIGRSSVGIYRDGKWSQVKFDPTHWVTSDTAVG